MDLLVKKQDNNMITHHICLKQYNNCLIYRDRHILRIILLMNWDAYVEEEFYADK